MNQPECSYTDVEWVHLLKHEPPDPTALTCAWQDICRFCYDQMASYRLDGQPALDAAHETLRRLLRSLHQPDGFRFECSLRSFWRTIAARCVKTIVTKEMKRQHQQVLISTLGEVEPSIGDSFTDLSAGQELILRRLQPCLDELPKRQRDVINLRYLTRDEHGDFVENSPETVATLLGIARTAVNMAASHAREALRRCLEARGYRTAGEILEY
jgi:RNA polymerase sigma factor (sigma-70 family)